MQTIQQDNFTLIKTGSNSRIYRYGDKQSGVILKAVPISCQKQSRHVENEYKLLKKLSHENVISVIKYKEKIKLAPMSAERQNGLFNVLVMEQASKGNLLEFYKRNKLTLQQIKLIFVSICNALQFLHCNYIAHRDIKLQNILVFQSQGYLTIKLADFGFASNVFDGEQIKMFDSFKGTKRGYMAPEIHQCLKGNHKYEARKSDCFALGVVLFSLVLGKLPFEYATKQNKLYNLIQEKKFQQFWEHHSRQLQRMEIEDHSMVEEFKNLFQNMVAYDVEQRYTIESVLEDEWTRNCIATELKADNFR